MKQNVNLPNKLLNAAVHEHPLLIRGLALVPAAMAAYSLKNAAAVTLLLFLPVLFCAALSSLFGERLPALFRPPAAVLAACAALVPAVLIADALFPGRLALLGAYVPLLAVSSLVLSVFGDASKKSLPDALTGAGAGLAAWGAVVCLLGAFRELFGAGTLWERPVKMPIQLDSMQQPFTALIFLAFAGALFEYVRIKYPVLGKRTDESLRPRE